MKMCAMHTERPDSSDETVPADVLLRQEPDEDEEDDEDEGERKEEDDDDEGTDDGYSE
jgi:hypothetical protein